MTIDTVISVLEREGDTETLYHVVYDGTEARVTCAGRLVMSGFPWDMREHVAQTDRVKDAVARVLSAARPVPPGGRLVVEEVAAPEPPADDTKPETPAPKRRRNRE